MIRSVFGTASSLGGFSARQWVRLSSNTATTTTSTSARNTFKRADSRKTYLVDTYSRIIRRSPILLVLHNNSLLKGEDNTLRAQIKKLGGTLTVTRSKLFNVALRGQEHEDPASKEAHKLCRKKKHPLADLFTGPTAVVSIPDINPKTVEDIVKVLDKTKDRLILLGGQIDGSVMTREGVDKFKTLPSIEQLRSELAGVLTMLGGAGLVQTLESSSKMLYLTLKSREKDMEGPSGEDN